MGYTIPYMSAILLFHRKNIESNGDIVEMKIWKVPDTKSRPEGLKYSLVYIKEGKRIIGYDNGEGKGHHGHYRDKEEVYAFKSIDSLIKDFYNDVASIRRGEA